MSVATLKKKTQSKYNNMSVGVKQFSLNGTHRNQGYVGQTTLSRSLPRTLARGNTLRGYGGTNGHFIQYPSVISAVTSTEDSNIIKPSVLSYDGMIATQYRWIKRPQPFTIVKPDNTRNANTQQDYIYYLQNKTMNEYNNCSSNNKTCTNIFRKDLPLNVRNQSIYNFTKPKSSYIPMSQSEYLHSALNKKCVSQDYKYQSSIQQTPFAC
jgi:hypothetical protein